MTNMWEMIELTFIIPNTASDQLFFNGFLDLIGLSRTFQPLSCHKVYTLYLFVYAWPAIGGLY